MEIRPARREDLPAILQYDRHIPRERLEECIDCRRIHVLLENGAMVGVLRFSLFWQTIPFLDLLYLDDPYRGRGLGSKAMAYWEDILRREGFSHAMLSTQEDETAKFFYEKLGYRRIGAFLPPEQEADEIIYLKSL